MPILCELRSIAWTIEKECYYYLSMLDRFGAALGYQHSTKTSTFVRPVYTKFVARVSFSSKTYQNAVHAQQDRSSPRKTVSIIENTIVEVILINKSVLLPSTFVIALNLHLRS